MDRLRSPLSTLPDGIMSRLFLQRSPPWLLTTAACGGLRSAADCRTRRALLHLSYSCRSSCGPAMLVTHDPLSEMPARGTDRQRRPSMNKWGGALLDEQAPSP